MGGITSTKTSASSQLGDPTFYPESGTMITKPNKEVWLRSGTVAASSLYPAAASVEAVMCHGAASVTLPTAAAITGFAHNGAGTAVAAYGDATNVLVTTNYGASWANVAHSNANPVKDVCWNGTQFITAGNSTSALTCSYSVAAAVFTAGGSAAGTTLTANTVRITWNGSIALLAAAAGTASAAATTTSGVTLTARTLSVAPSTSINVLCLTSLGANQWLIISNDTNVNRSTAADCSTWDFVSLPTSAPANGAAAAGNGYFCFGVMSTGKIYRSSTGATGSWVSATIPSAYAADSTPNNNPGLLVNSPLGITFDGTRFLIASQIGSGSAFSYLFGYTTDLVNVTTRQIVFPVVAAATPLPLSVGTGLVLLPGVATSTVASYSPNWFTTCDYVGSAARFSAPTPTAGIYTISRPVIGYVRVK